MQNFNPATLYNLLRIYKTVEMKSGGLYFHCLLYNTGKLEFLFCMVVTPAGLVKILMPLSCSYILLTYFYFTFHFNYVQVH